MDLFLDWSCKIFFGLRIRTLIKQCFESPLGGGDGYLPAYSSAQLKPGHTGLHRPSGDTFDTNKGGYSDAYSLTRLKKTNMLSLT